MKQFTFYLDNKQQRPVVILDNNLTALLDTGAFVPVWTDDEDLLKSVYNAKLIKKDVPLSGFGGTTKGNCYQITLQIGNLIYPNMSIVVNSELNTPFQMILSATMFNGLIYEIDDINHKLNVTIPDGESAVRNVKIKESNGRLHILCTSDDSADLAASFNDYINNK